MVAEGEEAAMGAPHLEEAGIERQTLDDFPKTKGVRVESSYMNCVDLLCPKFRTEFLRRFR